MTRYVVGELGSRTIRVVATMVVDGPRRVRFPDTGYGAFDVLRGRVKEGRPIGGGERPIVARETDAELESALAAIDARICAAEQSVRDLLLEKKQTIEAAIPRLEVARVPK